MWVEQKRRLRTMDLQCSIYPNTIESVGTDWSINVDRLKFPIIHQWWYVWPICRKMSKRTCRIFDKYRRCYSTGKAVNRERNRTRIVKRFIGVLYGVSRVSFPFTVFLQSICLLCLLLINNFKSLGKYRSLEWSIEFN